MDVSSIISKVRLKTNTSVGQKSDAEMLDDLNNGVYYPIFSKLWTKHKKYAWNVMTPNTIVVWQNEYTIPKETVSQVGLKRVLRMDVKYKSSEDWIPCWIYDSSPISTELTDYTDTNKPIVIQRDWSLFLYPAITDSTGSYRIEWQYIPLPLTLATTSDNIKLGKEYHKILVYGLNEICFEDKMLFDKAAVYKNLFEAGVNTIVEEWSMDIETPREIDMNDYNEVRESFLP